MHSGGRVGAAFGDVAATSILRGSGEGEKVVVVGVGEQVFRKNWRKESSVEVRREEGKMKDKKEDEKKMKDKKEEGADNSYSSPVCRLCFPS